MRCIRKCLPDSLQYRRGYICGIVGLCIAAHPTKFWGLLPDRHRALSLLHLADEDVIALRTHNASGPQQNASFIKLISRYAPVLLAAQQVSISEINDETDDAG